MRIPAWPSINPADLRHQIAIQSLTSTPDAFGQPQQTWSTILTANGRVTTATKQLELLQAGALSSQVTHVVTLRYPAAVEIQAGMRVVYGTHYYKIQAVDNFDDRNVLLNLLCLEINGKE